MSPGSMHPSAATGAGALSLHDRVNVDSSISFLVTLTHNTDAQEVILLCMEGEGGEEEGKVMTRERKSVEQKKDTFANRVNEKYESLFKKGVWTLVSCSQSFSEKEF